MQRRPVEINRRRMRIQAGNTPTHAHLAWRASTATARAGRSGAMRS
jgi:hypothetical protein